MPNCEEGAGEGARNQTLSSSPGAANCAAPTRVGTATAL